MKFIIKTIKLILLLVLVSTIIEGQTSGAFKIPMVRENAAIDSFIKQFKYSTRESGFKNDSCIEIFIYTNAGGSLFSIHYIDSVSNSNIYTGESEIIKKGNFRYFKYQNNFVLIWGDIDAYGFFKNTSKRKRFNIHIITEDFDRKMNYPPLYMYKNKKFKLITDMSQ